MNPAALQKLVADAITNNVFMNWRFYVALICVAVVTTACTALLEGWGKKKGEIAATRADFDEVKRQLKETTEAAKSVELSLSRNDWIQRERNTLKRLKLEKLIVVGYAISEWLTNDNKLALRGEPPVDMCPINEFVMLSTLYFPELKEKAKTIEALYRTAMIEGGPVRVQLLRLTSEIDFYRQNGASELHKTSVENRMRIQETEQRNFVQRSVDLHAAVEDLALAAHDLMEQLMSHPSA